MDISCPCVIPMTLHYDNGIPMALHLPMASCYSNGLALCLCPCVMTLPLCYTDGFALYQWSCIMLTVLHLCQWHWLVLQHCPWPCIIPIYCVIPMAKANHHLYQQCKSRYPAECFQRSRFLVWLWTNCYGPCNLE